MLFKKGEDIMSISVQTSHDSCEPFKKRKIVESLMVEVPGISEAESFNIARSVERRVRSWKEDVITTSEIRTMVQDQLIKRKKLNEASQYETIGVSVSEIRNYLGERQNDNANATFNPESVAKYLADSVLKAYSLQHIIPDEISRKHVRGDIHIHDLNYFASRLNCISHDPRFFFEKGLMVDGTGTHTSYAAPPKNLIAVVNWLGQIIGTGQCHFAGAQGIGTLNTFLAPFIVGMKNEEIKQCLQSFIFNLCLSYVSRGGEVAFSNLNIELCGVPPFMMDLPAIGRGGVRVGTYSDYVEEAQLIADILLDVLLEGDGHGRFHIMPNVAFVIRDSCKGEKYNELFSKAHRLAVKFPTPYFLNPEIEGEGGHNLTWGCRSTLATNWTGDPELDTLRCGNTSFVTMNLPRYAIIEKDLDGVLSRIRENMVAAKEVMALRVDIFNKNVENGMMKFLSQKDKNGEPYYRVENGTHSFGFVGVEEMLINLGVEDGLSSIEGQKIAHNVLDYINEVKDDWKEEDQIRYSVLGSPAEFASGRLASLDIKHYDAKVYNGTKEAPYYSNSSHLNVNKNIDVLERVKIESQFHKKIGGGQILHLWLGQRPNERCLEDMSKIIKDNDARYWTYTNDFSTCIKCNTSYLGLGEMCPFCGSNKTIGYSKISGYIQKVENWNKSKRSELIDRHRYNL